MKPCICVSDVCWYSSNFMVSSNKFSGWPHWEFYTSFGQRNSISSSSPARSFPRLHSLSQGKPCFHVAWRTWQVGLLFRIAFMTQGKKKKVKSIIFVVGSNAVQWYTLSSGTPIAANPVGASLFCGDAQILSGGVLGTGTGDPETVSRAEADRDFRRRLEAQVGRQKTPRLFHAEYWSAHHTAAFDHYPLWTRARSNDVEMKASVSQKQSSKPSKSL